MERKAGDDLQTIAELWPTPSASLVQDRETPESFHLRRQEQKERLDNGNGMGLPLTIAAMQWHSPRVSRGGYTRDNGVGPERPTLEGQTQMWPSPAERDYRSPNAETYQDRGGATKGEQLPNFVEHHFHSPLDPEPPTSGTTCWCGAPGCVLPSHKRRLNPFFVNWLMGWPTFWLAKEPMPFARPEMESFLSRQRQLLRLLFTSPDSALSSESVQFAHDNVDA